MSHPRVYNLPVQLFFENIQINTIYVAVVPTMLIKLIARRPNRLFLNKSSKILSSDGRFIKGFSLFNSYLANM